LSEQSGADTALAPISSAETSPIRPERIRRLAEIPEDQGYVLLEILAVGDDIQKAVL
jgi:hypothetical protein